ncbi:MAG: TetR/AcrR family transcriptional regulator [Kiritimatiellae bacterium]|nr:TetR/AcrR family transcriptional regulator [Kiritimatiellia bacterium]
MNKTSKKKDSVRKTRVDGIETREAIIAASLEEFAEKGFELASAREICRRAGVNSALLSRYFGSKEALYRIVAKKLFGDLGAPLANLSDNVTDEVSWRAAVREWVSDMLFMTIPTEKAQKLCAALFRHEVTRPTKFHNEFKESFGRPVYEGLKKLISSKMKDDVKLDLLTSSIWAQVSIYALADEKWHKSFRPKGVTSRKWSEIVCDHICESIFIALDK